MPLIGFLIKIIFIAIMQPHVLYAFAGLQVQYSMSFVLLSAYISKPASRGLGAASQPPNMFQNKQQYAEQKAKYPHVLKKCVTLVLCIQIYIRQRL